LIDTDILIDAARGLPQARQLERDGNRFAKPDANNLTVP
jgi:hypothetical protein